MRGLFAIPLLALVLPASANSAPAPEESWGKAGVPLAQYRQDALECALNGHYTRYLENRRCQGVRQSLTAA